MQPELVIFDCDGVLVDSERIAVRLDRAKLRELGIPLSESEIVDLFMGRPTAVMDAWIEEQLGHPLPSEQRAHYERRFDEAFAAELAPVDGVEEALDRIALPVCVASSSEPDSLRHKLELTGLAARFGDHVFSASQVPRGKPAPDLFLFAAEQMGAAPHRCAVIEDSRHGVAAARAAGMTTFAYTGGLAPKSTLAHDGVILFEDMRELPALLRA